jgi:asparagine synthase (glutamine-hydrolysing)
MIYATSLQTLLHYEDRMSMPHSVESRVPFLDHRLVELAFSLPARYKIQPPLRKIVHRQAIRQMVPAAIYDRSDKGIFSSPFYSTWMRNELHEYISDILNSTSFRQRGYWNLPMINKKWQAYLAGDSKPAEMLFNVIALETWARIYT